MCVFAREENAYTRKKRGDESNVPVIDVRLRRKVHDSVDILALQHVCDEVFAANVALDELEVRVVFQLLKV
jgi:hypothetical protein